MAPRFTSVIVAASVVTSLGLVSLAPAASADTHTVELPTTGTVGAGAFYLSDIELSPEQQNYLDKVISIGGEFEFDQNGALPGFDELQR